MIYIVNLKGIGETGVGVEHAGRGHVELRRAAVGAGHQGGSLRGQSSHGAGHEG